MKNNSLLNLLGCCNIYGYNLHVEENGFKMDFSRKNYLQNANNFNEEMSKKKNNLSNFLLLALLFLFTNFLFAQQPACNLKGILESKRSIDGAGNFTIIPDLHNAVPGTIYRWEFTSNTSGATFVSENNLPSLTVKPGNINGQLNIKLTLINPSTPFKPSRSCSCTKSVSISKL